MTGLTLWTIYDHPRDYPHSFVARRFENDQPTPDILITADIEILRSWFARRGMVKITRSPGDDPAIVETWL